MELHPNTVIIPLNVKRNISFSRRIFRFVFLLDDFKPASVMKSDQAELTVGSAQDVTITLPNVEVWICLNRCE